MRRAATWHSPYEVEAQLSLISVTVKDKMTNSLTTEIREFDVT